MSLIKDKNIISTLHEIFNSIDEHSLNYVYVSDYWNLFVTEVMEKDVDISNLINNKAIEFTEKIKAPLYNQRMINLLEIIKQEFNYDKTLASISYIYDIRLLSELIDSSILALHNSNKITLNKLNSFEYFIILIKNFLKNSNHKYQNETYINFLNKLDPIEFNETFKYAIIANCYINGRGNHFTSLFLAITLKDVCQELLTPATKKDKFAELCKDFLFQSKLSKKQKDTFIDFVNRVPRKEIKQKYGLSSESSLGSRLTPIIAELKQYFSIPNNITHIEKCIEWIKENRVN